MTLHRLVSIIIGLFALALLAGNTAGAARQPEALRIVTTTTQVTDLVLILAGTLADDAVLVTPLMGAGVDPHLYKPTEADIAAMSQADLVIYSGLHLEGQFDTVFKALGERNIRVYAVSEPVKAAGFTIGGFDLSDELTNVDDPHFWFDPRNWQLAAEALAEILGEADPENAAIYTANASAYAADLDRLYAWALEALAQVPESQRTLVTSHDAFQYFGAAFGWQVHGLQGISTEDEAGVADIQATAEFVIENNIPVMFVESSVPPNAIRAVQEAIRSRGGLVELGVRELFSDAMGEPGTFGGTYTGMIAQNVITILQSYRLPVPPWPEGLEPAPPTDLLDPQS